MLRFVGIYLSGSLWVIALIASWVETTALAKYLKFTKAAS
jgi:hypothetical protein